MLSLLLGSLTGLVPTAHADVLLVARGSLERWGDAAIGSVYRQGGFLGGAGVVIDVFGPLSVDVDLAYKRLYARSDETQIFELVPVTFLVEYTFPAENAPLDPFVGLGFGFAQWAERTTSPDPSTGLSTRKGARPSLELRAGIRFDLGIVQPAMARDPVVKGVDLELFGARRIETPGGQGFDLASWRGGLGLALRL